MPQKSKDLDYQDDLSDLNDLMMADECMMDMAMAPI